MASDDLDVREFVRILNRLPEKAPITEEYDSVNRKTPDSQRWYQNQKDHMVGWFRSQGTLGAGQYTRNKRNYSARTTYNRLLSPGGILWINEALGQDSALVKKAAQAASEEPNYRSRCRVIREILPWEQVAELAQKSQKALEGGGEEVPASSSRGVSTKPSPKTRKLASVVKPDLPKRKSKRVWPPLEQERRYY